MLRFGKHVRTVQPGLNYHLPYPIETVLLPKALRVSNLNIGMRVTEGRSGTAMRDVPEESLMLTGDENIVDVDFTVLWRIKPDGVGNFLFNIQNPEGTVKAVAESAMREVIGRSDIQPILTGARTATETAVQELMQKKFHEYGSGVLIQQVQLQKVDPPAQVIDAFRDVQAARADQERLQNEARTYANRVIPDARGRSAQILQGAEGYKEQTVAEAKGQTARFLKVYEEYRKAPDVTRQRIHRDHGTHFRQRRQAGVRPRPVVRPRRAALSAAWRTFAGKPQSAAAATTAWSAGRERPMKAGISGIVALIILAALAVVAYSSLFVVRQTEQALVVRLGEPVRVVTEPGLNFKLPFIDTVISIDKRILDLENPAQEIIASDQKRLVVDAFARYRINNALRFYQSVGSIQAANLQLATLLNSALRRVLGEVTFSNLVRDNRAALMIRIRDQLDRESEVYGISVIDVRIRLAGCPSRTARRCINGCRPNVSARRPSSAPKARSAPRRSVPAPIAKRRSSSRRRTRGPSSCAATATASATASSPKPTARMRNSSPSIARCRPMRPACRATTPASCCGRIRISSASSATRRASRAAADRQPATPPAPRAPQRGSARP